MMNNDYGMKDGEGVKDKTHIVYDCSYRNE
jgi:hypothetical protein